ncbi:MAG: signal peptidase II [Peptococcaceae bacterium]|nr:signal peptidase II [Peptococcaceae bacterium]
MRIWVVAASVLLLDRITKLLIVAYMNVGESWALIPHFFHLTYVRNTGAAFGLFSGQTKYLIILTFFGFLIAFLLRKKLSQLNKSMLICLGLIIGGALGNFIDRVYWDYVVDFIDFRVWPFIFNIADSALVVGSLMMALLIFIAKDSNEPAKSADFAESADTAGPAGPAETTDAAGPADTADAADPAGPADTTDAAGLTDTIDSLSEEVVND